MGDGYQNVREDVKVSKWMVAAPQHSEAVHVGVAHSTVVLLGFEAWCVGHVRLTPS